MKHGIFALFTTLPLLAFASGSLVEIGGLVVDEDGKPLPGERIKIETFFQQSGSMGSREAVSGSDGRWSSLVEDAADALSLRFGPREGLATPPPGDFRSFRGPLNGVDVKKLRSRSFKTVFKKGIEIKGTVLLPDGAPAVGAQVSACWPAAVATSGNDGSFVLHFEDSFKPGSSLELAAKLEGFAVKSSKFLLCNASGASFVLKLEHGGPVSVFVSGPDGKPLEGVSASTPDWPFSLAVSSSGASERSGSDGVVKIARVPVGGVVVAFSKTGFFTRSLILRPSSLAEAVSLEPLPFLKCRVVDASTGEDLSNVTASLNAFHGLDEWRDCARFPVSPFNLALNFPSQTAYSSEGGRLTDCCQVAFKSFKCEISVSAEGYGSSSRTFEIHEGSQLPAPVFKLERLRSGVDFLTLRFVDSNGAPVEGALASWRFLPRPSDAAVNRLRDPVWRSNKDGFCFIKQSIWEDRWSDAELFVIGLSSYETVKRDKLRDKMEIKLSRPLGEVGGRWLSLSTPPSFLVLTGKMTQDRSLRHETELRGDSSFLFDGVERGDFELSASFNAPKGSWVRLSKKIHCETGERLSVDFGEGLKILELKFLTPKLPSGGEVKANFFCSCEAHGCFYSADAMNVGESFALPVPADAKIALSVGVDGFGRDKTYGLGSVEIPPGATSFVVDLRDNKNLQSLISGMNVENALK